MGSYVTRLCLVVDVARGTERSLGQAGGRMVSARARRDIRRGALTLRVRRGDHAHAAYDRPIRL